MTDDVPNGSAAERPNESTKAVRCPGCGAVGVAPTDRTRVVCPKCQEVFDLDDTTSGGRSTRTRVVVGLVVLALAAVATIVALVGATSDDEPDRPTRRSSTTVAPSSGPTTSTEAGALRLCFSGSARKVDVTQAFGGEDGAPHLGLDNGNCLGIQSVTGGIEVSVTVENAGSRGDVGCSIELAGVQLVSRPPEPGRASVTCSAAI